MQFDSNKQNQSTSATQKGFKFPKWLGIGIFVIFGGYAGIKQFIADSPSGAPETNQSVQNDRLVAGYAKQLADRNNVKIIGQPKYDLKHELQLVLYSTSDDRKIICSLKTVDCFFKQK
jgi:hypothetical protein